MKSKPYFIINHEIKEFLIKDILDLPVNEKYKVTISKSGTKSQRQQALDWKWDSEILKSGIGWDDKTAIKVHARAKWMFARPILLESDELFAEIYNHFIHRFGDNPEMCIEFAENYISTQKMSVSQAAEYMTNKQNFWTDKDVNLTDPSLYNLEFR